MQTDIKREYDAASPGNVAVLPSFRGSAEVMSCRAAADIYPGDAVKLLDGTDTSIIPMLDVDDASVAYGIATRSHSNFPFTPQITSGHTESPVTKNSTQGVVINGPIWVKLAAGANPKIGDLAIPTERNINGSMQWAVATAGQSRFVFAGVRQNGGVAIVRVESGALLGEAVV